MDVCWGVRGGRVLGVRGGRVFGSEGWTCVCE